MKSNRYLLGLFATLLFLVGNWHPISQAGVCLAKPFKDLVDKHVQFNTWLYHTLKLPGVDDRIAAGKRWQRADPEEAMYEAHTDIQASAAKAHEAAGPQGTGPETVQAQMVVFINERVANSNKTSLEESGEGIGRLAGSPRFANKDAELANIMLQTEKGFEHSTLVKLGYTDAEYYAAWKKLLDPADTSPPVIGEKLWTEKLVNQGFAGPAGGIAEVEIASRLKQPGVELEIGPDEGSNRLPKDCAVDIWTPTGLYQVGIRGGTIRDKLVDDTTGLALQIKLAWDHPNGKLPNGQPMPYKFAMLDKEGLPIQSTVTNLNNELSDLYDGTPPQVFLLDQHFIVP